MKKIITFALLFAIGCEKAVEQQPQPDAALAPDSATTAAASPVVQGTLRLGVLPNIIPCGTADSIAVADPNGLLAKLPSGMRADTGRIFAIVHLDRAATTAELTRLEFASMEPRDCFLSWRGFEVRAQGNEPGWVVEINGNALKLQRQGGTSFDWNVQSQHSATGSRYWASSDAGSIELTLTSEPCTDTMSGSYYAMTAVLELSTETLKGCALRTAL